MAVGCTVIRLDLLEALKRADMAFRPVHSVVDQRRLAHESAFLLAFQNPVSNTASICSTCDECELKGRCSCRCEAQAGR